MIDVLICAVAALFGAAAYRLRGSELWARYTGRGVGTARLMWAAMCSLACAAGLPAWWLPLAVFAVHYGASTLPQFGSIDIGHRDGNALLDVALQSGRGLVAGAGVATAYWFAGEAWLPPLIAGLAAGPLYALAWAKPVPIDHLGKDDAPETGEILYGAAVGISLALGTTL